MRPIKFRAWTGKKIISWDILKHIKTVMLSSILAGEHRDYIPMQSTGLFDRNDKEIYEGDIIKRLFYGKDRTIVVERDEDYGGFNISYWLQEGIVNTDTRVVIGNIYENPELVNA